MQNMTQLAATLHEYAFDVTLQAAIRVTATSREEAEKILREKMDAANCNGGAWDNGDPILFEASVNNNPASLFQVDGVSVEDV